MGSNKINKAYRFLKNGSLFVATHPDDLCPTEDGYDIDIGPFIRMFESMTGAKAEIVGKPNRRMLEMAAEKMGVRTSEVVMVGDRIYTDMRMAENAGTRSVLVLSGEATREDLEGSGLSPTAVVGLADIPALDREIRPLADSRAPLKHIYIVFRDIHRLQSGKWDVIEPA